MFLAKIKVTLKKSILDPQGKAVEGALQSLKYENSSHVRVGKYVELQIDLKDREKAIKEVEEISKKILSNPVIEDFTFDLEEVV